MRDKVVIIGGGQMGCGIASIAASAGEDVVIWEVFDSARHCILEKCDRFLQELVQYSFLSKEEKESAIKRIQVAPNFEYACEVAEFVIEAIVEDLSAKQALFETMDEKIPPEVILASNTSGLRITDIGLHTKNPQRLLTTHFWFPAHLVPLVEVVMSDYTSETAARAVKERLIAWGKAPVIVKKDLPGQLANRILQAVIREASAIVEMGLATPQDVDTAVKMGMGLRFPVWGPLEHVDAVGLDLCYNVQNTVLPDISGATAANSAFDVRLEQGDLGFKTGRGFYDWSQKDMQDLQALRNAFIVQSVKFIQNWEKKL